MSLPRHSVALWTRDWALSKGLSVNFEESITSTMDLAKSHFPNHGDGTELFLTHHQSQGRGRGKRSWQDFKGGESLLSTWCFRQKVAPQPILAPLVGLALFKSVQGLNEGLHLRLKAPNDLLIDGAKVSGLLIEVSQMGQQTDLYVGLGLNVWKAPQMEQKTTHLSEHMDITQALWFHFCDAWLRELSQALTLGQEPDLALSQRQELLKALNGHPEKRDYVQQVSPQADLYTAAGVQSWIDL